MPAFAVYYTSPGQQKCAEIHSHMYLAFSADLILIFFLLLKKSIVCVY